MSTKHSDIKLIIDFVKINLIFLTKKYKIKGSKLRVSGKCSLFFLLGNFCSTSKYIYIYILREENFFYDSNLIFGNCFSLEKENKLMK